MVWRWRSAACRTSVRNGKAEVNPLVDNGMLYNDRRLGHGLQDRCDVGDQGKFVWTADAAVRHAGISRARAVSRLGRQGSTFRMVASSRSTATTARLSGTSVLPARTSSVDRKEFYTVRLVADGIVPCRTAPATAARAG